MSTTRLVARCLGGGRVAPALDPEAVFELDADPSPGSWVLVERDEAGARVAEVLAEPHTALAQTYALAAARGLDPVLPDGVEAEAAAWARSPGVDDPSLVDLTHLPFATIDEQTSKDLDQAVAVERRGDGWRVWYAIADAAHFVRPGMALFAEALRRGASAYLPGLVIPMLPRVLSEDKVSLNPGEDRRAVVFELSLAADGRCVGTTLHRARVRSRCKTWFDAVQALYDGGPSPTEDPTVTESLRLVREVGEALLERAEARAMVAWRRAEVSVSLPDAAARRYVALADLRNDVERYNEQISVLANVEGARALLARRDDPEIQAIYRVHQPPPEEALADLRAHLDALIAAHGLAPARWRWDPARVPLARWLDALPSSGPEGRIARAVHRQALLANHRSVFQREPAAHHGVGAPVYGRFTAPMREVVGVFLHKELAEALGWAAPCHRRDDERLREEVIAASHRARNLQRELDRDANRLVLDQLFGDDLRRTGGQDRRGTVMGLSRDKVHVQLDDPPIDVKVYYRHLELAWDTRLATDEARVALVDGSGAVRLAVGDAVRVRAVDRDTARDRWRIAAERLPTGA